MMLEMNCRQCGVWFRGRQKDGMVLKYCSRACRDEARRTGVRLVCRQCGVEFYRKKYQESWSQERGPFCSMPCYGEWQREWTGGPENPNWRPQSPVRGAGQWERNRQIAIERDSHTCQDCGSVKWLHVHHVVPWAPGQADPHALDNLRTLCIGCHQRTHRKLKAQQQSLPLS